MPKLLVLFGTIACAALLISSCTSDDDSPKNDPSRTETPHYFPTSLEKDIDILFVIDNSASMQEEQANLAQNFPRLIEALRSVRMGASNSGKPCTLSDTSGCNIPNLHIGVISTDLGTGPHTPPSCTTVGGDGGRLQAEPRVGGCTPPSKSYISYLDGTTNVENTSILDPVEQVKAAFQCIAKLGTEGCGYEHSLESARRALDPRIDVNPGFIREDAMLAVVFITDEDDCSAAKPELFDPSDTEVTAPLGPLTSFRCFEFGVKCDINDRLKTGPRQGCAPAHQWLFSVEDYVEFFKGLKPPGRVIMFAIAGPTDTVAVGTSDGNPALEPSCQSEQGKAVPAIRLEALIDAFGAQGFFNRGVDPAMTQFESVDICSPDFSSALRLLGRGIVATMNGHCLSAAPLTSSDGVVCATGDDLGQSSTGQPVLCRASCLDKADCSVSLVTDPKTSSERSETVPRCDAATFADPADTDCGQTCPCWRLMAKPDECRPALDGSPYGLEILRKGPAPTGAVLDVRCVALAYPWASQEFADFVDQSQCR